MSECEGCKMGLGLHSPNTLPYPHVFFGPRGPTGRDSDYMRGVYVCIDCYEGGNFTREDFDQVCREADDAYQSSRRTCKGRTSAGKPCKRTMGDYNHSDYCSFHAKEASQ